MTIKRALTKPDVVTALGGEPALPEDIVQFETTMAALIAANKTPLRITAMSITPYEAEPGHVVAPKIEWTLTKNATTQTITPGPIPVMPATLHEVIIPNVSATTEFTLTVENAVERDQAKAGILFKWAMYVGTTLKAPGVALTDAEILALSKTLVIGYGRDDLSFVCGAGAYPVIIWPAYFGEPEAITVGGLRFTDFYRVDGEIPEQLVTNDYGVQVLCKILRFNSLQYGTFGASL